MGARTFTDDSTGEKFELTTTCWDDHAAGELHIKPIKAVEKKTYKLSFGETQGMKYSLYSWGNWLTEPTAQKVAETVEALMEGLQDSKMQDFPNDLADKFIKARAAFQEDV